VAVAVGTAVAVGDGVTPKESDSEGDGDADVVEVVDGEAFGASVGAWVNRRWRASTTPWTKSKKTHQQPPRA
jgi:hypothetical protein